MYLYLYECIFIHVCMHTYTYERRFTSCPGGVIVVSIVFGGSKVCIAYTSVSVNLWNPKHVFGYLYEYCSVD